MKPQQLQIELLSDSTFGRGTGTAGEVDVEVEHDLAGLPLIGGKVLHGLLRDAWLSMADTMDSELGIAAQRVLGQEGDLSEGGILHLGDGVLDETVRQWVSSAITRPQQPLTPPEILRSLTAVRQQTAQERSTGGPEEGTLRSSRVVLSGTCFQAPLTWFADPEPADVQCLALMALGVRHAGLGRNRGRGHVRLSLDGDDQRTCKLARGGSAS